MPCYVAHRKNSELLSEGIVASQILILPTVGTVTAAQYAAEGANFIFSMSDRCVESIDNDDGSFYSRLSRCPHIHQEQSSGMKISRCLRNKHVSLLSFFCSVYKAWSRREWLPFSPQIHHQILAPRPRVEFCCLTYFDSQHTHTHSQRPSMYSGRRRCGGGSGTKVGGNKTNRGIAGASSSPPSTTLPASKSSLNHDKCSRVNSGGAAFSVRLQAKDILAELERSAGKSGGFGTSGRGREADHQVRERERRITAGGVLLSKSDGGTFFSVKRQTMFLGGR